jgi:hypothetical protein
MWDIDTRFDVDLAQVVRLATDATQRPGYVVAVMLIAPYEALVRWRGGEATFEPLDSLVALDRPRGSGAAGEVW